MKKVAIVTLFALLVVGPASVWASMSDGACAGGHHGTRMQQMDDCPMGSCCSVAATRHSGAANKLLERAAAVLVDAPLTHDSSRALLPGIGDRCHGWRPPASAQTTPVLRL